MKKKNKQSEVRALQNANKDTALRIYYILMTEKILKIVDELRGLLYGWPCPKYTSIAKK